VWALWKPRIKTTVIPAEVGIQADRVWALWNPRSNTTVIPAKAGTQAGRVWALWKRLVQTQLRRFGA